MKERERERERETHTDTHTHTTRLELQIIRAHLRDSHFQGCFAAGLNAARIRS